MGFNVIGQVKLLVKQVMAELAGYWQPIFMYLLLSILVLAPFIIWSPYVGKFNLRLFTLLLPIGLCVLALASRFAFVVACLLLLAPALVHQHLSRHWGIGQADARFEAYFESPPGEIHEYLGNHIDAIDVAFVIGAACYVVALLRGTIGRGNAPRLTKRIALFAVIAGIVAFVSVQSPRKHKFIAPYEMATQVASAKERYRHLSLRNTYLNQHPLGVENCQTQYDNVVIVLGESATTDHMSVFGYKKPTTPFAAGSSPEAFEALSPSNQTRYSLGMMLTRAGPGDFDSFLHSHSLVGQLRTCGFHTLWISNQGRRGEHDSFASSMALEADEQIFLNEGSWKDTQFDGVIVQELDARGVYAKTGQAVFIHLIGSHTDYANRVPVGFGFQDASGAVSHYDNSILYTDHVLSELYHRFAGSSLLFIYVSDHGQVVSQAKSGSGYSPGYQQEFRTPLLIWTNDNVAIQTIRDAIGDSRLNLESFDDVVRYLVGRSPTPNISTRQSVSILTPDNVRVYAELESFSGN